MNTIKRLWQTVLNLAGSKAMPKDSPYINIPIQPSEQKSYWTAPDNGYVRLRALGFVEAVEIDANNTYSTLAGINDAVISNNSILLPVKKGDRVGLLMRPYENYSISEDHACTFHYLVGGGGS